MSGALKKLRSSQDIRLYSVNFQDIRSNVTKTAYQICKLCVSRMKLRALCLAKQVQNAKFPNDAKYLLNVRKK